MSNKALHTNIWKAISYLRFLLFVIFEVAETKCEKQHISKKNIDFSDLLITWSSTELCPLDFFHNYKSRFLTHFVVWIFFLLVLSLTGMKQIVRIFICVMIWCILYAYTHFYMDRAIFLLDIHKLCRLRKGKVLFFSQLDDHIKIRRHGLHWWFHCFTMNKQHFISKNSSKNWTTDIIFLWLLKCRKGRVYFNQKPFHSFK